MKGIGTASLRNENRTEFTKLLSSGSGSGTAKHNSERNKNQEKEDWKTRLPEVVTAPLND